jgi:hypothetical protein
MLAASTAPAFIRATDKSDRKPKIVGSGECQYVVEHDCMQVPDHIKWQDTHGVALDAAGLIYVKHRTKTVEIMDAVVVFDDKGRFVRSFGKEYHGGGHGIDIRKEGNQEYLYLCDNKGYIAKTTLKGETVWKQTAPKLDAYAGAGPFINEKPGIWGKGRKFSPTNIAFAPDRTSSFAMIKTQRLLAILAEPALHSVNSKLHTDYGGMIVLDEPRRSWFVIALTHDCSTLTYAENRSPS